MPAAQAWPQLRRLSRTARRTIATRHRSTGRCIGPARAPAPRAGPPGCQPAGLPCWSRPALQPVGRTLVPAQAATGFSADGGVPVAVAVRHLHRRHTRRAPPGSDGDTDAVPLGGLPWCWCSWRPEAPGSPASAARSADCRPDRRRRFPATASGADRHGRRDAARVIGLAASGNSHWPPPPNGGAASAPARR